MTDVPRYEPVSREDFDRLLRSATAGPYGVLLETLGEWSPARVFVPEGETSKRVLAQLNAAAKKLAVSLQTVVQDEPAAVIVMRLGADGAPTPASAEGKPKRASTAHQHAWATDGVCSNGCGLRLEKGTGTTHGGRHSWDEQNECTRGCGSRLVSIFTTPPISVGAYCRVVGCHGQYVDGICNECGAERSAA